ncbi:MAG: penicillin-binding protein 2 [Burkholderiaceae bacterium]
MVEVRNPERELRQLRLRLAVALAFVIVCFGLLVARFAWLQVHRYADFHAQAEDNRIALLPVAPARGLIYDRNGVLLAENVSAYTLELSPKRIGYARLDETIDALTEIVDISALERRRFKRLADENRRADSLPLKIRLTDEEVARLAVQRYRFHGVEIRARLFRHYPLGDTAAHVLGYIGRISVDDLRRLDANGQLSNYAGTTHIGKIGVELSYEDALHGRPGTEEVEVSAGGRVVRTLSQTPPVPGATLYLSIDIRLQRLAEELLANRRGALVVIEPASGDVLALVSSPTFDPNLFVDGIDTQTWQGLNENPDLPLLNRPLRGAYPPGSTYKPFVGLAALSAGLRNASETISDPGYFQLGNHRFRDSRRGGHGTVDLRKSIVVSSDTYYYKLAYEIGVDRLHALMKPWGFGQLTGIDLAHETAGILPSTEWKMRRYKQRWLPGETPSVGIGQGYNAFTILQLAQATATLANRGQVIVPHVVRVVENPSTGERQQIGGVEKHRIPIRPADYELVRSAMVEVNRSGTGRHVFGNAPYSVAGKTGTSQVVGIRQGERYDADRLDERHRDHSLFVAFAPAEAPRVAIAAIIENGGFGAQAAAPLVRQVLDYILLGQLPDGVALPILPDEAELRDVPEDPGPEEIAAAETPSR